MAQRVRMLLAMLFVLAIATSALAAGQPDDTGEANLIYDPITGNVKLDPAQAPGGVILNFVLKDTEGGFNAPGVAQFPFSGILITDLPTEISQTDPTTTGFSATWDMGNIFPTGMPDAGTVAAFLDTATYVGQLGTGVHEFDIVTRGANDPPVPEPAGLGLIGLAMLAVKRKRS